MIIKLTVMRRRATPLKMKALAMTFALRSLPPKSQVLLLVANPFEIIYE